MVNPVATTTSPRMRDVLTAALEGDLKLEVAPTTTRGHAVELARQAVLDAVDLVVVLGGDGTVNEVVNGLLGEGGEARRPALAVVPGGGTNVFARALGIPADPVEATGALLGAIRSGRSRTVGLGRADGRWFTFHAGMGWDAAVVARVDRRRRKNHSVTPPRAGDYVRAALHEFYFSGQRRRPPITVLRADHEPLTGVHMAIVANTSPWTYFHGRPLRVFPDATFDSGLDLYALTRLRTVGTLAEVRRIYADRVSTRAGQVHRSHDLSEITLRADRPTPLQVDGEHLGLVSEVTLRSAPKALNVVV